MSAPVLVALALLAVVVAYGRVLIWRHRRAQRVERRRDRALERAEPFALGLIDGDVVLPRAEDARALSELLTEMAPTITGDARHEIAAYFLSTGELDAAITDLGARQWPRRARAAAVLGDMCHERAHPPLIAALDDPHPAVRLAAARSLGRLTAVPAVEKLVEVHLQNAVPEAVVRAALVDIGAPALPHLRSLVQSPDADRAALGAGLLGQMGGIEDASLVAPLLRHSAAEVRRQACRALGQLGDTEPAADVALMLDDAEPVVRTAAAHALAAIGDRSHAAALVRVAQTGEATDATAAAHALAVVAPDLAARVGTHSAASTAMRHAADALLERYE